MSTEVMGVTLKKAYILVLFTKENREEMSETVIQ